MHRPLTPLAFLLLLVPPMPALAYIERLYAFEEILNESSHILVGRLEAVDAKARTAVAAMERSLKGPLEYRKVLLNIGLGPAHHADFIVDRLAPGADVILFYKREGGSIAAEMHAGDIWFQLYATDEPANRNNVWWRMTHVEIRLNRTFNGKTAQLVKLTDDVLAKRVQPPKPNPNVPPIDIDNVVRRVQLVVPGGKEGGFHRQDEFRLPGGGEIRGIACADLNADGLLDVLACRQQGNVLLANQPNGFQDDNSRAGVPRVGSRAAAWADYNGDGHPDLMTSNFQLFTNLGGTFQDDSAIVPAPPERGPEGAGWIDYNADGLPDILITNGDYGIRLFRNTGTGPSWFSDVSSEAGLGPQGIGNANGDHVAFFDADGDGWVDFFYNLGDGVLARNERNGTFRLDANAGLRIAGGSAYKRGLAPADYDNDGRVDVFVPGPGRAQLFRNNGDGTLTDVIDSSEDLAKVAEASFSAAWGDVNGDGNLDLFVCHPGGPSRLYLGDGRGKFKDVSEAVGVRGLVGAHAALFADVDNDGDLDLIVNLSERIVVATNDLPRPPKRGTLIVQLRAQRGVLGGIVRVYDDRGRPAGLRELNGAEGCGGQANPVAHFGLPVGTYLLSACLSDGRVAQRRVPLKPEVLRLTFEEAEFK